MCILEQIIKIQYRHYTSPYRTVRDFPAIFGFLDSPHLCNLHSPIPDDIMDEIELKEPESLIKTVKLIHDAKHTKQYSVKIPTMFIEEIGWQAGDNIEIEI